MAARGSKLKSRVDRKVHIKAPKLVDHETDVVPIPEEILEKISFVHLQQDLCLERLKATKTDVEARQGTSSNNSNHPLKKKDRRKQRREQWLQKMKAVKFNKISLQTTKEREKTVIVGDLQPLVTALPTISVPSIEPIARKRSLHSQNNVKTVTVLSEVDHFQQVLSHPAFKANPLDTITQHIKNATALKKI